MKKIFLFIFLFFFVFKVFPIYSLTVYPVDDFYSISKSGVSFQKKDILPVIAFVGISALLFWQDDNIKGNIRQIKRPGIDDVLKYTKYLGNGWYLLAGSGLTILAGETFLSRRYTFLGVYMIEGIVISGIFVTGAKFLFGRARPGKNKGPYFFKPFSYNDSHQSLYSGHTTEAFTFASIISHFFKNIYVSSLVYTIASLTAIERVYNNKHWPSDVFIGSVAGILIGTQIVKLNKDYHQFNIDDEKISISFKLKEF